MVNSMPQALKYLEDIQGLITYHRYKSDNVPTLKYLINDLPEDIFQERVKEFRADYPNVLDMEMYENRRGIHDLILLKEKGDEIIEKERNLPMEEVNKRVAEYAGTLDDFPQHYSLFEIITYHLMIRNIKKMIEVCSLSIGLNYPNYIAYGTISTGGVNAYALRLENGEGIIILEQDLMHLLHLTAKIIMQSFLEYDDGNGKGGLVLEPETIKTLIDNDLNTNPLLRFKDALFGFLKGSPREAEAYRMEETLEQLGSIPLFTAEFFIAAHEFGHIVKEHNKKKRKIFYVNPETTNETTNHDKEYEADQIGLQIVIEFNKMHGTPISYGYYGIEMFFIIYDIASRALNIYKDRPEETIHENNSHPHYIDRINELRRYLKANISSEMYEASINLADSMREILEYFWDKTKGEIGHRNGN